MDMDQTAVFLSGSILISLSLLVIAAAIITINNLLHKYWKPVRIFTADSWNVNNPRYITEEELIKMSEAALDKKQSADDNLSKNK